MKKSKINTFGMDGKVEHLDSKRIGAKYVDKGYIEREQIRIQERLIYKKNKEIEFAEKILLSLLSNSNYVPSCNRAEIDNVIKKSKEIARVWMNDKDTDD